VVHTQRGYTQNLRQSKVQRASQQSLDRSRRACTGSAWHRRQCTSSRAGILRTTHFGAVVSQRRLGLRGRFVLPGSHRGRHTRSHISQHGVRLLVAILAGSQVRAGNDADSSPYQAIQR